MIVRSNIPSIEAMEKCSFVVNEILICLIGDHDQVASLSETRHSFRFFPCEDYAGRILRGVVVDGPGAIAGIAFKRFLKAFRVEQRRLAPEPPFPDSEKSDPLLVSSKARRPEPLRQD